MLKKLEHVGIAVADLDEAVEMYRTALEMEPDEIVESPSGA